MHYREKTNYKHKLIFVRKILTAPHIFICQVRQLDKFRWVNLKKKLSKKQFFMKLVPVKLIKNGLMTKNLNLNINLNYEKQFFSGQLLFLYSWSLNMIKPSLFNQTDLLLLSIYFESRLILRSSLELLINLKQKANKISLIFFFDRKVILLNMVNPINFLKIKLK